jgi:hypothetical protein
LPPEKPSQEVTMANVDRYRKEFESLDWSQGLTKNDLMMQCAECPSDLLDIIPANRKFTSFEEFWAFFSPSKTRSQPNRAA